MTEITAEKIISTLKDKITPQLQRIVDNPDLTVPDNESAFGYWIVDNLLPDYVDSNAAEIGIPGNEHGIDILDINAEEEQIIIVQNKWSDEINHSANTPDISRLSTAPKILYEQAGGNEIFKEKSKEFKKQIDENVKFRIKLIFVLAGEFTSGQLDEIKIQPDSVEIGGRNFKVEYEAIDRKTIYNRLVHPKTEQITLECEKSMFFLHGQRDTLFFIAKGKECNLKFKKDQYLPLFELNPRFYLEANNEKSINAGIIKTATDDQKAKNFLEYNNGVTCLCDDFEIKKVNGNWIEDENGKKFIEDPNGKDVKEELILENLKIVNGCQTILSLAECKDETSENVNLLFKLYKIDEGDLELKEDIYTYTNSQNRLSERDLASDQQAQINLQQSINNTQAGFFWKRKSGEELFYEKDSQWKEKHSPSPLRIMDNVKCAKLVHACYNQDPYEAVMIKAKDLFDKDEEIFERVWLKIDPQKFIFAQILEYCRSKTFTELKKDARREQAEKIWKESYEHTENIQYLENNYFKNGCLAIFVGQIQKQSNSDEIKKAIMKLYHWKAKKDGRILSEKKRMKEILLAFGYFILKLDKAVSAELLSNRQANEIDPQVEKIQPMFEEKDVYLKLSRKVQNDIDTATEKQIYENLFQKVIDQANDLDSDPFHTGFSFKI